jgi:hypothetical protein
MTLFNGSYIFEWQVSDSPDNLQIRHASQPRWAWVRTRRSAQHDWCDAKRPQSHLDHIGSFQSSGAFFMQEAQEEGEIALSFF